MAVMTAFASESMERATGFVLQSSDDSCTFALHDGGVICDKTGEAMPRRLALIACAMLAACATTDAPQIEGYGEQRCLQESRIGSNISATKCYDRWASEQQKRDTEQIVDEIRRTRSRNNNSMASGGD
jgi:hypothetical protein